MHCKCRVCKWEEYSDLLTGLAKAMEQDDSMSNENKRFSMYKNYTFAEWGFLGKKNRKKLPKCVQLKIRELFPETEGVYVGFKGVSTNPDDADTACNENDDGSDENQTNSKMPCKKRKAGDDIDNRLDDE